MTRFMQLIEGMTTSKVKKNNDPLTPQLRPLCWPRPTQWSTRGALIKKIIPTFFCLNLLYISQLRPTRSDLMSGLVKVTFLGSLKRPKMAFYTINLREWISFETLKNAQPLLQFWVFSYALHTPRYVVLIGFFWQVKNKKYIKPRKWPNLLQIELFSKIPFLALAKFLGTP